MLSNTKMKKESFKIIEKYKSLGWVLEPDAKALIKSNGLDVPDAVLTSSFKEADDFLKRNKGRVVAKAVSKKILHKTEHGAVVTGISDSSHLKKEMTRLKTLDGCENILVENMVKGIELIIGAKNDVQFGPVIIFGIGGTSVEIYNDTAIRMAPLKSKDVPQMVDSLTAKKILTGYRGNACVDMDALTRTMVMFSNLIMDLEDKIDSVDLNPVICTEDKCIVADARIMLK